MNGENLVPVPPAGSETWFSARHVPTLAAFAGKDVFGGPYIHVEPNPEGGVDMFSTGGAAMCWIHDRTGGIAGVEALRFTIPRGLVRSCRERVGPSMVTEEGEQIEAPLPPWTQPGKVRLVVLGGSNADDPWGLLMVEPREKVPLDVQLGDAGIYSASGALNEKSMIRSGELRLLHAKEGHARQLNFRGPINRSGEVSDRPALFDPALLAKLKALPIDFFFDVSLRQPDGMLLLTSESPEAVIRVSIMPMIRRQGREDEGVA